MAGLSSIESIVVLMLENRSMDHMLGYLYASEGNVSPGGQPFAGLKGGESNPGGGSDPVAVFPIEPDRPNAYLMPGADPGEGYMATNSQLFGSTTTPAPGTVPAMEGFVADFAYTLKWQQEEGWSIVPGTTANDIMGCFTPQALPVLSGGEPLPRTRPAANTNSTSRGSAPASQPSSSPRLSRPAPSFAFPTAPRHSTTPRSSRH